MIVYIPKNIIYLLFKVKQNDPKLRQIYIVSNYDKVFQIGTQFKVHVYTIKQTIVYNILIYYVGHFIEQTRQSINFL